jgi:plasmid stabilization system protein ParE
MPRHVYRKAARRDLDEIAAFIKRESQDRAVAKAFVNKLFRHCEHLAQLPGLLGSVYVACGPEVSPPGLFERVSSGAPEPPHVLARS